jgi:hypothetical protein
MFRLQLLALKRWYSTVCQYIGVGKVAHELVLSRYLDERARW